MKLHSSSYIMKKANQLTLLGLGTIIFTLTASLFINANLERTYLRDEYVESEHAHFVKKIEDKTGLVKAHKFVTPTDNKYSTQKSYSHGTNMLGNLEDTWTSYTGKGTKVAIIDDGFDYTHPEYTRSDGTHAILSASRYYYASGNTAYYKSYSSDPTCIGEDWDSEENEWATHGTNVSTTAAAPMNNNGGVGIAPEADILALKIDFSFVAIEEAIDYAISQKVDVINMSLGAYSESFVDGWGDSQSGSSGVASYLNSVCQKAYNNNIIVVAAAGNESTWHKSYPACNYKVIGVGALEENDESTLAAFTNYVKSNQTGEINVDILAPGYVYTAKKGGGKNSPTHTYGSTQGTSFSSPIVAGAACLWKQKNPNGTPDQFLSALQSSASDIGSYSSKMIPVSSWYSSLSDVGPSNITCGRLNVSNLLDINDPYVTIRQSSVNIVVQETKQIELDTYNGTISYSMANPSIATVSNNGLVTGVASGSTTLTVTATKNAKTAQVTIPVTVTSPIACSSISINPTSTSIEVGQTYEIEPTIATTPNNADRLFMYASKDETVATVDFESGVVTALKAGSTTIDIEALYGTGSATLNLTVTAATTPTKWNKVTSENDITDGDYLIVYETGSKAFDGSLSSVDVNNNTIDVTISNNSITYNNTNYASRVAIKAISGGYSIKTASGFYIGNDLNKNTIQTNAGTAITNYISISSGNALIVGTGGRTLAYNSSNDQQRFRYMSTGGDIQLYKANSAGAPETVSVTGVTLSSSSLNLEVGGTSTLTATVNPDNASNKNVTWSSSNTNVASVSGGVVTAIGAGSATITVTTVDGSKTATCSVTVTDSTVHVTGVTLSPTSLNLTIGGTSSLTTTVSPNNATNKNVNWSSSNENIATVSDSGTVTAVAAGNAVITVTTIDGEHTATCSVTVTSDDTPVTPGDTHTVTYAQTSTTAASVSSGTAPTGSSISFNNTFNTKEQIANNNSQTWTLNGYAGLAITSIQMDLKRSSKKGAGTITLTNSGSSVTLALSSLNTGNLTDTYTLYEILEDSFLCNGTIIITISATESSVYCDQITLTYGSNDGDKVIGHISASYSGPSIFVGGSLDESKISVTAIYTNSDKYPNEVLASNKYTITGFNSTSIGEKTLTITYTGSTETSETPLTTTLVILVIEDTLQSISVTSNKTTFSVGESISKSNLTMTAHYASGREETVDDYEFSSYTFTYSDAPSGGGLKTKSFEFAYQNKYFTLDVKASRTNYVAPSTSSLTITGTNVKNAGVTGTGASGAADYDNLTINKVSYSATNIYVYNDGGNFISFGKGIGDIHNTTPLDKSITSLSVSTKNNSRTDTELWVSVDGDNWVLTSSADFENNSYRYFKVGYTDTSEKYSNISTITIGLRNDETAVNVANYIMFEDTNNQCLTKLDTAITYFNNMSKIERATFMSSDDLVMRTARERLEAWMRNQNKEISLSNGDYVVTSSSYNSNLTSINNSSVTPIIIIAIISLVLSSSVIVFRKRIND